MLKKYLNVDIALVIIVIASVIVIVKKGNNSLFAGSSRQQKSISKSDSIRFKGSPKVLKISDSRPRLPTSIISKALVQRPQVVINPKVELLVKPEARIIEPEDVLVELDYNSQDNFKLLFSTEEVERDFLLNHVGLSTDHYNKIHKHRKQVQAHLRNAETTARATGTPPEVLTKPILAQHVYWMENSIGVGNYNLLQEILSR